MQRILIPHALILLSLAAAGAVRARGRPSASTSATPLAPVTRAGHAPTPDAAGVGSIDGASLHDSRSASR